VHGLAISIIREKHQWFIETCDFSTKYLHYEKKVLTVRFEPRSGRTKDYKIGICCFSAKLAAIRRKSKDWLDWNQDNLSEWGDMSICGMLFQWARTIKTNLSVLVLYKADLIIISLKINLFSPWYSWKFASLALNNNHSLTLIANISTNINQTKKSPSDLIFIMIELWLFKLFPVWNYFPCVVISNILSSPLSQLSQLCTSFLGKGPGGSMT